MPTKEQKEYTEAVGRRKTAIARVRITPGGSGFKVNGRTLADYFPTSEWRSVVEAPLTIIDMKGVGIEAHIKGGGVRAQSEAMRHGIARALVKMDADNRKSLKAHGYLTRDPRAVERKKFGLKKARKAPKWSKR